jgi:fatty acid desaturase
MASIVLPKKSGLFRYSNWDVVPVLFSVIHLMYLVSMLVTFHFVHLKWQIKVPLMAAMGIVYSFSISWNINGISHNFIHNRYFNSPLLNRLFSLLESADCLFSQVLYDYVHRRHHMGNSDKPGEDGDTLDWLSIYRHGHDGHAENVWKYTFFSFFRDDPKAVYREIKKGNPNEARWGLVEVALTGTLMVGVAIFDWKFMVYFVPFWYFGHCLSYLNGYFEHFGGNPDVPMAWGVSSYHKLYNFVWFNNGYHAEHHFRPRAHWTRMKVLKQDIEQQQREVGVRVIKPPHVFGFADPDVCDEPLVPIRKTDDAPDANDLVDVTEDKDAAPAGARTTGA